MKPFHQSMVEYRKQLQKGDIKDAYRGLMEYMMNLRTQFEKKYPDYIVSSTLYFGYMDMTYFSFFPKSLQRKKLKIAIVFCHETFRFEAWLAGSNKQIQTTYWNLLKESGWDKYHLPPTTKGVDSILESTLVENPDFSNLDMLSKQIEKGTLRFITDVEQFLSKQVE